MELDIIGKTIKRVFSRKEEDGFCDNVSFVFDDVIIAITVDHDTDELIIQQQKCVEGCLESIGTEDDIQLKTPGGQVVYYWISNNNMGYLDLFVLGIEEALPTIVVSCAASEIYIRETVAIV